MEASLKAHPILLVFHALNTRYEKDYCWPSQKKIMELLARYRGVKRCRATLNLWLTQIVTEKYIIRRRRIKRDPKRGMIFKSTMYKITRKGYYYLVRSGVNIPAEVLAKLTGKPGNGKRGGAFANGQKVKNGIGALVKRAFPKLSGIVFS